MRIEIAIGEIEDGCFVRYGSQTLNVPDTFKFDAWQKGRTLAKAAREILPWCKGQRMPYQYGYGDMESETPYRIGKGPIRIVWWIA